MADHEDYLPGETPSPHKTTHQDGGADEISVAGLLGVTTAHQDAPDLIEAHRLVAGAHHAKYTDAEAEAIADAQIAIHALVANAHHDKYTDASARFAINNIFGSDGNADADIDLDTHKLINVVDPVTDQGGDTKKARNDAISTHAGLAAVHQDAPALIETHRLAAGAHHAKYTDAEAVAAIYAAKPCFSAKLTATVSNVTGDGTAYSITGAIWTEINDSGSNFSNGTFTAPASGIYLFSGIFAISGLAAAHTQGNLDLMTSNRTYLLAICNFAAIAVSGNVYLPFSVYVDMDAADTAYLRSRVYNGTKIVDLALNTFFGCSRII
jgi:hypothetical protein